MNKSIWLALVAAAILMSCSEEQQVHNNSQIASLSSNDQRINEDNTLNSSETGVTRVDLVDGKAQIAMHKDNQETVFVEFNANAGQTLSAQLTSDDSDANLRFSQIFFPDGSSDGPFGKELNYSLKEKGHYKLAIHENAMAGEPWHGDFAVSLQLK